MPPESGAREDRGGATGASRTRPRRPWLYPSEHAAKAEVYQEFADTFAAIVPTIQISDKERRKREVKRLYMRLALVDPCVRDGLRDALADADEHWRNHA